MAETTKRIAVVGSGPAGLMAAETLARGGCQVDVFEHRRSPARKFLLAGRSGLNLTNARPVDDFVNEIGDASDKVEAAVRAFDPGALVAWSESLGHPTQVGSSGRVFPDEWRAAPLLRSWLRRLDDLDVTLHLRHRWTGWADSGALRFIAPGDDGADIEIEHTADATVLALGGPSWPSVGSGGEWSTILGEAGVSVTQFGAANAAVLVGWSTVLLDRFEGQPIKGVNVTWQGRSARGDLVITAQGLEGTPVYTHAAAIGRAGGGELELDLSPDRTLDELASHLAGRRRPRDSFTTWARRASLAPAVVAVVRDVTGNQPPTDPVELARLLKALPLAVTGVASIDRAISTTGGVAMSDVSTDFELAQRPGTFVVGEMLDVDAPTGGWLLQIAFSTGVAAAQAILHES